MVDTTQQLPRRTTDGGYETRPALYLPPDEPKTIPGTVLCVIGMLVVSGFLWAGLWTLARTVIRILGV